MPRQTYITYGLGGSDVPDNITAQYEIEVDEEGNPTELDENGSPVKHYTEGN